MPDFRLNDQTLVRRIQQDISFLPAVVEHDLAASAYTEHDLPERLVRVKSTALIVGNIRDIVHALYIERYLCPALGRYKKSAVVAVLL